MNTKNNNSHFHLEILFSFHFQCSSFSLQQFLNNSILLNIDIHQPRCIKKCFNLSHKSRAYFILIALAYFIPYHYLFIVCLFVYWIRILLFFYYLKDVRSSSPTSRHGFRGHAQATRLQHQSGVVLTFDKFVRRRWGCSTDPWMMSQSLLGVTCFILPMPPNNLYPRCTHQCAKTS